MADIPNRDELERALGRKLGKVSQEQYTHLVELLGNPPSLENVPAEFWAGMTAELRGVLGPFLQKLYLDQAAAFLGSQSIGVDWALVNQAAVDWAGSYTFDLVKGITENTQSGLQQAVSAYFENGQTIGQLEQSIGGLFGPVRSELIAVTEITRAASQGEQAIVDQILKDNPSLQAAPEWQTNRDDRVCPICAPRNGKKQGDGWQDPPPAHPGCRCWINHKIGIQH